MGYFQELPKLVHPDFAVPNRKPVGAVEIDWSHPLSNGLLFYVLWQDGSAVDLVSGRVLTLSNIVDQSVKYDENGCYIDHSGYLDAPTDFRPMASVGTGPFSIATSYNKQGITAKQVLICQRESSGYADVELRINSHSPNLAEFITGDGGALTSSGAVSIPSNTWDVLAGVRDSAGVHICYSSRSAASFNSGTIRDLSSSTAKFSFGGLSAGSSTIEYTGNRRWDAGWSRALSAEEYAALYDSNYQILKPANPITYFIPSAGGGGSTILYDEYYKTLLSGSMM